jgi:tRNA pseudouridine55 synthase
VIDGLAVVDKPAGMTSHDVVARCRKVFGQKRVGHAGTLDPDATGVLLVGLGRATRLMQYMSGLAKSYDTEIELGVATTTLDAAGEETARWDMAAVTLGDARAAVVGLTGTISQVPPMVSAVKIGGRRLHELARQGIEVDRPARTVTVSRFAIHDVVAAGPCGPVLSASVDCSSGTYIRVLAADLGAALGGGAHVRRLRRTAVGPWVVAQAAALDDLGPQHVRPPADALPWMEAATVSGTRAVEVAHGRVLDADDLGIAGEGPWRVLGPSGDLLAVYARHGGTSVKPAVVVAQPVV